MLAIRLPALALLISLAVGRSCSSMSFLPVATFAAVSYHGGRTGTSGIVASGFMAVFYVPPAGSLMMIDIGSIGNIALYIALALGVVYAIYRFRARFGLMSPIMSGIAEGIISTNRQGTIRYLNPAAEELTGWSRSDASGKPAAEVLRLLDEKTHESVEDPVMKAIRENKAARLRNYVLLAPKDGAEVPVEVTASPLRDHRGKLLGAVAVFQDVSRHRQMLDQASHSQKMEAVGRLAGGVAGDFNNLLTIITGYSELLRSQLSVGNPLRRFADEIQLASERAAGLTRQLLSFSRGQIAQPRLLDQNTILANMDTMLRRLLGERIELVFLPGPGLGRVKCDPGQIEQIIVNLAMNSRDAMSAGGKFVIETANVDIEEGDSTRRTGVEPGAYVMMAVSDTGSGMDNETRSRLFEPFFTTKAQGKGTGLGLSIVYGIVKQNQGQITVYSQVDCGTIFEIYLPRAKEMVETVHRVKPARLRVGTETILLVDDEDGVRKLCSAVLQSNRYTVIEAGDGAAGLAAYEKNAGRIDLLLTDIVMPHLNGFELAERLSQKDARLGVLYMSGYRDNPVGPPGKRSERTFLHKPFTPDVLLSKVRESLDARSSGAPGEVRGEQPPAA